MSNPEKINLKRPDLIIALICALITSALMLGVFVYQRVTATDTRVTLLESGWTDESGEDAKLDSFDDTDQYSAIYYQFDSIDSNQSLLFHYRNVSLRVYEGDTLIYEDQPLDDRVFGKSYGSKWSDVQLTASDDPVTLRVEGIASYGNSSGYISTVYLGNTQSIFQTAILQNLAKYLLNFVWMVVGLVLIVIYLVFQRYFHFEPDLLLLGIGTLFCAIWCGSESGVWQLLIGGSESIHIISYISLVSTPIPFALLFRYRLRKYPVWKTLSQIFTYICEAYWFLIILLHFSKVLEFHYATHGVHLLILMLFPFACKTIGDYAKNKLVKKYTVLLYSVFGVLCVCIALGMVFYLVGSRVDYSLFIRIALFFFLMILFIYQMVGINEVFVKGIQADYQHELSLMDYLTKFYNRAGFSEHRAEYVESPNEIGIVQFDLNDLKKVNDLQGHEKGDEMLCLASTGIYQSFSRFGRCYRTGGDEFLVMLTSEHPEQDFEEGIKDLQTYCQYANSDPDRTFDLAIAYGYSSKLPKENLDQAIKEADRRMYEKKRQMKGQE